MLKYLLIDVLLVVAFAMFGFGGGKGDLVSYEELAQKLAQKENFVLLDVRTQEEYAAGHIEGAVLLPYDEAEKKAADLLPDKGESIVVYCRSAIAAESLRGLGYANVRDFGGINRWQGTLVK